MREIKFRGLRKADKTWSYGDLIHGEDAIYVMARDNSHMNSPDFDEVIPETVGQFTGLTDNNGVEIYEGDVIEFETQICRGYPKDGVIVSNIIKYGLHNLSNSDTNQCIGFYADRNGFPYSIHYKLNISMACISGNIHENPELL